MATKSKLVRDIESLLAVAKDYDVEQADKRTRLDLIAKLDALRDDLDDPVEKMFSQITNYSQTAAVNTLLQLKVFHNIPREGTITAKELAVIVKVDLEVLTRLMRILTATNIFRAAAEDTYAHTKFSLVYIDSVATDFFTVCVDEIAPAANRLPEYFSAHDSAGILNPRTSPYSWHNDREGKNFYECILEWPERLQRFNIAMTTQEAALPVLGMFPFATLSTCIDTSDPERAFIVDVAGGRGQSLLQITREIKENGVAEMGRVVLEDQERVLDAIPANALPGVEKVPIDFFTPQPIKNAQIYYLRRIIHNWQDREAIVILSHIADAMAPDSRLLIGDMVVPEVPKTGYEGLDMTVYWMDMCMLVIGGKERSEREFKAILDAAGLRLIKIWWSQLGSQTVLECRLKE
ncbi:hypothetical protein V493_06589 [Pseudogymnoascus sp. VKM F-4281 (FW-2241)]|nr:hypothetical protein V493_06589 [Pseudogymnoascus sp. VKM F-4281 (FW-2241)]